jgi:hypothetical protein
MSKRSAVLTKSMAALALVLTTTACATLLRSALGRAGVENNSSGSPRSSGSTISGPALPETPTHSQNAPVSIYKEMPTPRLWSLTRGPVHSVAYSISRWAQSPSAPMPLGIDDVLPVAPGAPITNVASWGPVHVEAFGIPGVYISGLVRGGDFNLSGQMMRNIAREVAYGRGCGSKLFFGVRFGSANATHPMTVMWE